MSTTMQEINSLIDNMVEQKTFSLDVLNQITELRNKAQKLQLDNERLEQRLEARRKENEELMVKVSKYESEIETVRAERANQLKLQEQAKLDALELRLVREHKNEIKDVVLTAFRNPTIKHNSFGTIPVAVPNMGHIQHECMTSNTTVEES